MRLFDVADGGDGAMNFSNELADNTADSRPQEIEKMVEDIIKA